ncbi:MAG: DUF445 family protein [Planctomycetes bacterium]|nr:DUF445 family protein [Planctomycetota bacterium]
MDWVPWVMLPLVGGAIGWVTNLLAIKMLFHPRQKTWGMQGLLPRRQKDLADSVGDVVGKELVPTDELLKGLDGLDLTPHLAELLDQAIAAKLEDVRKIPLIGSFVTPDRIAGIRDSVLRQLADKQPVLIARFKEILKEKIDIGKIAKEKLAAFDLDRLERIVNQVASKEFRAIEWWGLALGIIIGVVQAGVLALI